VGYLEVFHLNACSCTEGDVACPERAYRSSGCNKVFLRELDAVLQVDNAFSGLDFWQDY